jgi:hypothetical protein
VIYQDGQPLAAADLRDHRARQDRMRALHVSASHGVWGVALGMEVELDDGGRAALVGAGLAYDCAGREVLLRSGLRIEPPLPPARSTASAWWFDLLTRHEMRGASLRWSFAGDAPSPSRFADDVRLGEDVPLARVQLAKPGSGTPRFVDIDRSVRRVARGLVRPKAARSRVRQGSVAIAGSAWDWIVQIDTSAARFDGAAPFYFARLVDHPWLAPTSGFKPLFSSTPAATLQTVLGPFLAIEASTRTSFRLRVRAAAAATALDRFPSAAAQPWLHGLPVPVDWLGIDTGRPIAERSAT